MKGLGFVGIAVPSLASRMGCEEVVQQTPARRKQRAVKTKLQGLITQP